MVGRDHSTIINSLRRIEASVAEDPSFAGRVAELRAAVHNQANEELLTADGTVRIGSFPQHLPQHANRHPKPNCPQPKLYPQALIPLKKALIT